MEKKVRVCTDKVYVGTMLFVTVAVATAFLIINVDPFANWILAAALVVTPLGLIRWVDCTPEGICASRCFFIRRKIEAKRISSVQFVSFQQKFSTYQYFIICIDGHRPFHCGKYKQDFFFSQLFFLSPKVISVRLLKNQCPDYIEKISRLYDCVAVDEIFAQMQSEWGK